MNQIEEFKQNLIAMKEKLEPILKGDTDKFIQITSNYIEQNEKLLSNDRPSLYDSIMRAAQAGLYIDGQESALVPRKGKVTFMPMYKGLLKQVRNSGELASIHAAVVYEHDDFEFFVDENGEHLKHSPKFVTDRGKPILSYAIARMKDSKSPYIEVMTEKEIQDCKPSYTDKNSPWEGKFADEMRKKTPIRRVSKRLPSSTDLNAMIHADDDLFMPPTDETEEVQPAQETSSNLRDAVKPQENNSEAEPELKKKEEAVNGDYKEGMIDECKIFDVTREGKPDKRYGARMGDAWFGTFNNKLYEEMCAAYDKKSVIWLIYEKRERPNNKGSYNEALAVKVREEVKKDDVVPI